MANLITDVHVPDADGTYHIFHPGDDVPAWAVKAITNPAVWDVPPVVAAKVAAAAKKSPAKKSPAKKAPAAQAPAKNTPMKKPPAKKAK